MPEGLTLAGQVLTDSSAVDVAYRLTQHGLASKVRESSHYTGSAYVRFSRPAAPATFEKVAADEYLIRGDAESESALVELAEELSRALSACGMCHRIELSDRAGVQIAYLHHGWHEIAESP